MKFFSSCFNAAVLGQTKLSLDLLPPIIDEGGEEEALVFFQQLAEDTEELPASYSAVDLGTGHSRDVITDRSDGER